MTTNWSLLDRQILDLKRRAQMVLSADAPLADAARHLLEHQKIARQARKKASDWDRRRQVAARHGTRQTAKILLFKGERGHLPGRQRLPAAHDFVVHFCRGARRKARRFIEYDKQVPALTAEIDGEPVTFISDHNLGETRKVTARTANEFFKFNARSIYKVKLVVLDFDRQRHIEDDIPAENLDDLSDHFLKIKANR